MPFVFQPGEDVVAKVEKFRRGANYTAMWLPKMEWIVSYILLVMIDNYQDGGLVMKGWGITYTL